MKRNDKMKTAKACASAARPVFLAAAICACSLAAAAATRTLKNGVSDWTLPASYDEGVAPVANDLVALPADRAVTLDAVDKMK